MLLFKAIIFAVFMAGYSYSMSFECYELSETECPNFNMEELPKTVDDLKNYCSHLISHGHCYKKVYEKCAKSEDFDDTERDVRFFKTILEFVESSCEEDSGIFQIVADNLRCMTSTLDNMDGICQPEGINRTTEETLYDLVEGKRLGPMQCVSDAWLFYCMTSRFDVECGSDTESAVSEIIYGIDFVSSQCTGILRQLSYFGDAFKSEFRTGKHGEAAVPGILEAIRRQVDLKKSMSH